MSVANPASGLLSLASWIWIHLYLATNGLCQGPSPANIDKFLQSIGINSSTISSEIKQIGGSLLACDIFAIVRNGETVLPSSNATYTAYREAHWSATSWASPTCIYNPISAQDVAFAVRALGFTGAKYAVRAGGHEPLPNFSNINSGVLISMANVTDISYDPASRTVRTGFGNHWGTVYKYLQDFGRMVVGGRAVDVGEALTLGGGLSHLSNEYGFSADNVVSFELVLADSSIVTASATSNPDLFFALKGGGSNFGIVTHMTLKSHPLGQVWGGVIAYNNTYIPAVMEAFARYQQVGQLDIKSAILAYMVMKQNILLFNFAYLAPLERPECFQPFYDIPPLYDTTKLHDTFTDLLGEPLNTGIPRSGSP